MHQMNIADRYRDHAWSMNELEHAEYALISVNGDDGFPYNVPMCVFRVGDDLYFHTALKGRLNDLLARDGRVCMTCVNYAVRDPENTTMRYRSAMVMGQAQLLEDKAEKMRIMKHFFDKYLPNHPKEAYYIDRVSNIATVYRITVAEAVGKESPHGHNV